MAEWARANDVRLSCSRTGNCHDNAVAESFFATLKNKMYCRSSFAIGYQVPAQAMESLFERTKPAEEGLPMAA